MKKIKILLAEDDVNLGSLLQQYLEAKDYDTQLFADGEEAYKAYMQNDFDLCILDVMMPKRDGFELAKSFDEVEGVDFSVRFVGVGAKLKENGFIAFHSNEEGEIVENKKVTIEKLGYEKLKEKVSFWQGDACNLKPNFNSYDLVMATNLIDRLYNPRLFLDTIDERLNKDGVLIIASPYTWQESSTKKEFWLGGFYDKNGEEAIRTIDVLKEILSDKFELIHLQDLEFVIKETSRKFQHTISQVSVWRKK